jgi:uncharacterized protein (TIGR01777 family)
MKVLVTGSSGLVGSSLVSSLKTVGHEVVKLVRSGSSSQNENKIIVWDSNQKFEGDRSIFEGFHAVIHLAGKSIADGRWNREQKNEILQTRTVPTRNLADIFAQAKSRPEVFISASAVGYYGNRGEKILDESSSSGSGFLSEVCVEWEKATEPARAAGIRVVHPRIGMVLSAKGGALKKMITPFKYGLGAPLGSGNQWVSWICIDDLMRCLEFAIKNTQISGPINAVSPNAVTNLEFSKILAKVFGKKTAPRVPAFILKIILGEMAEELLLSSAHAIPKRLKEAGFSFQFPDLEAALSYLLREEVS